MEFNPCGKDYRMLAITGNGNGFVTFWIEGKDFGIGRVIGEGLINDALHNLLLFVAREHGCKRAVSQDHPIGRLFLKRRGFRYNGEYWELEIESNG